MASTDKFLAQNGLSHLWALIKAKFSALGHTHALSTTTKQAVKTWSAGSTPTLGTAFTIPNISKKTVVTGGTKTAIPNISVSSKSIPNVTSVGTAASAAVSGGTLTISDGTAPTLGTAISVGSASAGAAIEAYTALTTGDSVGVGTAFTVPNVTGVGTVPSLVTEDATTLTSATTGAASA